jgi:hypothetical protein
MIVRTFTGPSLRDALKSVRDSFGADAVILDTRFGEPSGGRLGADARTVSVTAAFEPEPLARAEHTSEEIVSEGPKTLHLKGGFTEETFDGISESSGTETPELEPIEIPAVPLREISRVPCAARAYSHIAEEYSDSASGNRVWPRLSRWLATQPELISGITDSFATHLAESLPPLEPFLSVRLKGQNVLFVGERGAGKSTLMFKAFAARWKSSQRRPGLRVISELEGHGQEHLESLCRGSDTEFSVHEFDKGRLEFDRGSRKSDIFAEFVPGRTYSSLARHAKIIRRALKPNVVALVLNASGNPRAWDTACERFAPFGITHAVFTHWDECQPWWDVTAFSRKQAILLSYRASGFEPIGEIDPFTTADLRNGLVEYITRTISGTASQAAYAGEGR